MYAQGKRHDVWMPGLGTCIASTAHTLTLCARCVVHTSNIPLILVLTCAEQEKWTPQTPNPCSGDNPGVLRRLTTRTQCMCVT